MKCIVLAGGKGNSLWPLSRENYPKQFMDIKIIVLFSGKYSEEYSVL